MATSCTQSTSDFLFKPHVIFLRNCSWLLKIEWNKMTASTYVRGNYLNASGVFLEILKRYHIVLYRGIGLTSSLMILLFSSALGN